MQHLQQEVQFMLMVEFQYNLTKKDKYEIIKSRK